MNITKREIVTCVILSIITCGIYAIYWEVKLAKELVSVKDPNDDGVIEVILMIFLPFLGCYLAEKKFYEGCKANNLEFSDNSVVYLILGIFVGIGWLINLCLMQNDINKLCDIAATQQNNYY